MTASDGCGGEIASLGLTDQVRFHLLRHFRRVSGEYLLALAERLAIPVMEAEAQLGLAGSKFYPDFAGDPDDLWDRMTSLVRGDAGGGRFERLRRGVCHTRCTLQRFVGTDGIIALEDLPAELAGKVKKTRRGTGEAAVLVLPAQMERPTRVIHILAGPGQEGIRLYTIFPGTYAPPLPKAGIHPPEELEEYTRFWNSHVLIEP